MLKNVLLATLWTWSYSNIVFWQHSEPDRIHFRQCLLATLWTSNIVYLSLSLGRYIVISGCHHHSSELVVWLITTNSVWLCWGRVHTLDSLNVINLGATGPYTANTHYYVLNVYSGETYAPFCNTTVCCVGNDMGCVAVWNMWFVPATEVSMKLSVSLHTLHSL